MVGIKNSRGRRNQIQPAIFVDAPCQSALLPKQGQINDWQGAFNLMRAK